MNECPKCNKSFESERALSMHKMRVHTRVGKNSSKLGVKARRKNMKNGHKHPTAQQLTLSDAIIVLKAKRDGFNEVINLFEGMI
jgi:hypothetical protein